MDLNMTHLTDGLVVLGLILIFGVLTWLARAKKQ